MYSFDLVEFVTIGEFPNHKVKRVKKLSGKVENHVLGVAHDNALCETYQYLRERFSPDFWGIRFGEWEQLFPHHYSLAISVEFESKYAQVSFTLNLYDRGIMRNNRPTNR